MHPEHQALKLKRQELLEAQKKAELLKTELKVLERNQKIRSLLVNTNAKKLAVYLHEQLCVLSHIDECSWGYNKSWEQTPHAEYLEKAEKLLHIADDNMVLLKNIIAALKHLPY